MSQRDELRAAVVAAWRSFGAAAPLKSRVSPAIPILFFGDLDACAESLQRVLTVGLNPSRIEFLSGIPFHRFPLFYRKRDGTPRSFAYTVLGCWHLVSTEPALFVFCPASQTPLGSSWGRLLQRCRCLVARRAGGAAPTGGGCCRCRARRPRHQREFR